MEILFFETVTQDSLLDLYRPKIFSGLLGFLIFYSWVPVSFFVKNNILGVYNLLESIKAVSYTHLTLPTNREV